MESYTVKELSKIINASELTIKRRIKDGKLKATIEKDHKLHINEDDLKVFLDQNPKYKKIVVNKTASSNIDDVVIKLCSTIDDLKNILLVINSIDDPVDINFIIDSCKLNKQALDIIINRLESKKA